ncbi:MAG TPA: hypothetical protein VHA37_02630, partial [Candidatus Saccharimonadales bacterium]|nr:hypothetical protein [Candidatus Saccharimonadales bacterium]
MNFSDSASQYSFHLQNTTVSNLTVSVRLLASEAPPAGQPPIVGTPPLLVRGALNTSNLTYSFTTLPVGTVQSWTLPP